MRRILIIPLLAAAILLSRGEVAFCEPATAVRVNPLREAYYGDLHLHTSYSFDAYIDYGTTVGPDEAYRFAKGEAVQYLGEAVQRRAALDFMAVTDHAESIGVFNQLEDPNSALSHSEAGAKLKSALAPLTNADGRRDLTRLESAPKDAQSTFWKNRIYFHADRNSLPNDLKAASQSAWQREIDYANHNYEPGRFTTFIAFEWTSFGLDKSGANLHRNVIFKGDSAPYPFSSLDSKRPEDLWHWLETIRRQGFEALAIPHNGNASNGLMYDWVDSYQRAITQAYAEHRQANEPLSEISQIKGSSETHPLLSPNDEFANFEILDFMRGAEGHAPGSYLRDALGRGLIVQRRLGVNPFKYGFVGGSDLHSGLSVSAQADYRGGDTGTNLGAGKLSRDQAAATLNGKSPDEINDYVLKQTSGSLTGVWAESNTRDSIYAALRRKETFATSGTRVKFRFFGGWAFEKSLQEGANWIATAYATGVPMGSDLPARPVSATAPSFAIWAVKDPDGANLDRVQVIKVWEESGQRKEKVFDVVWAGTREPDRNTGKLPDIGNTVDRTTGKYTNSIGVTELKGVWQDPEFSPRRFAAYYLRVLEIPTPRWSTLLAIQNGLPSPKDVPNTTQERGWSSPIWYSPPTKEH